MHDLRKQALGLESGKTMSRKARSKLGTPSPGGSRSNSAAPSRSGSRVPSRNVSDDEGDFSDGTQWSTNSIDEMIAPGEADDEASETWISDLNDRMNEIIDRKRSSAEGREQTLVSFISHLMRHFAQDQIKHKMGELVPSILKSVKSGQTERETVLALRALGMILITDPRDEVYDTVADTFKRSINDGEYAAVKIAGIRSLSAATFYGGASTEEVEEVMDLFLDIVSSDGAVVEAPDNAEIVTAALEEWGFLATQLEDMEETTEAAMDTFVDQLESGDVDVQVAAGENIALLFEKSYTDVEPGDDVEKLDPNDRLSKKDRKQLHTAFADIAHTVEKPTRGPRYSTALDEDGREYGSRMKVNLGAGSIMTIDAWWKLARFQGLKRLLQAGFLVHYEFNEAVYESLPVVVDDE
ncbi:hypothetical protein BTJ68_03797 [Hortaea werneckii EXF-2000]|uniref:Interferon-related developmental regulator N-terminal domain-containing protein n=1 Tax=Hortaea werneckii EXF-2000 TaxID=1157616 RepID=A0A1Z5THK2_HORWE|nr:hypothetical protein BTJ68_03797 [Hortaea werneckii EXF-2000]